MNDILWTLIGILMIPMYIVISTNGRVVTRQVYIFSFSTIHELGWVVLASITVPKGSRK